MENNHKVITCEQFISGHFKEYGSTILKSPGVDDALSPENWTYLLQQGGLLDKEVETRTILWKDKLVAYTFLKPTRDEYERRGVWNHTILVPIEALIDAANLTEKIGKLFARRLEDKPTPPLPILELEV